MLAYLSFYASVLRAASSSSSPIVLALMSGSLCKTLREFFKVVSTAFKATLLSVILAGSPKAEAK